MSLRPEQKACRECVFDGKDGLPTGSGKFMCLPFMFDKKLDSLVVVIVDDRLCTRLETRLCPSDLNRRPVESVFLMARMHFVWFTYRIRKGYVFAVHV